MVYRFTDVYCRKYEKETPLPTPTYKVNKWMRKDQGGRPRRDQEKVPLNDEVDEQFYLLVYFYLPVWDTKPVSNGKTKIFFWKICSKSYMLHVQY